MRIAELLIKETMILDLKSTTKNDVINELANRLDEAGRLNDRRKFVEAIQARESQSSTGIGDGVAIPHAKTAAVKDPTIVFGRSEAGIDYDALDGKPSHLFFMIAASEGANNEHLQTLSRLSTLLIDEDFRNILMAANSKEEILTAINEAEAAKIDGEKEDVVPKAATAGSEKYILAVTGCPTGIAHTYMAADSLKDKAKEMGVSIKVETNGSDGVKNRLTADDIAKADAIIIASDTKIEKERFKGKLLIDAAVTDGIRKPKELINRAVKGDAPTYRGGDSNASESTDGESDGTRGGGFYKHLMNGVSNMLPFVVGGGILIAISFFFGIDSEHPFAEALMTIGGGNAFGLMIPVLAGFIAMSIADRPGLAPGMVAGLIASTGEAGFLGGIIAGFLAGYIVVLLKKGFAFLPQSLAGIKTILIYPLFGIFFAGYIMLELIIDPVQAFNRALEGWLGGMGTTNIVLMGILLGGMMAIDMGGPINKAAFTFGIAMIDAGNFAPHAAIMAGGMVPPLGIALATTFFKNKFTKQEREAGKTNYVMGASFITEGAIPFAAADPARVIPAIVAGSAVAGGLSMLFGNTLMAPHGGLFVVFVAVENWPLYFLAIAIGAVVTALLVGFLKKPVAK